MGGEIGHHRSQGCSHRSHTSSHRTTTGGRTLACGFVCKILDSQTGEVAAPGLLFRFQQILHHFLVGIEGFQVIKSHRLDGYLKDILFGDTCRAVLLGQEIASGFQKRALRH